MEQLEVIVTKRNNGYLQGAQWVRLPNERLYHRVITDEPVVGSAYQIISGLETVQPGGGIIQHPWYVYWFRWSVDQMTTLLYTGASYASAWQLDDLLTPRMVNWPPADLMNLLHEQFAMPYWLASDGGPYFVNPHAHALPQP
jgi:hypothetical protein